MNDWPPSHAEDYLALLAAMPAAVTVLDPQGRILWFNGYAPKILDRKPEYIGRDIRDFHKPGSNERIDRILQAYQAGDKQEYTWQLKRGDQVFTVRVAPLNMDGGLIGLVHVAVKLG